MNGTLLKSEKRTDTTTSDDVVTQVGQRGVLLVLDVTEAPEAADTLTLALEGKDPASGSYVELTKFAAGKKGEELKEGGVSAFEIYPGASDAEEVGNLDVQSVGLPARWRVKVTHSGEGEWTYSVGASPLS
jgi:hypothetical protein